jgi:hypothetical protein
LRFGDGGSLCWRSFEAFGGLPPPRQPTQTQVVTVTKLFDEILDCLNSKIDLETIHHLKNVLREKKKMK